MWGTGEWEWETDAAGQRRLPRPRRGAARGGPAARLLVSWNNGRRPAGRRPTPSGAASSIYRAKLLEDAILAEKPRTITPVRLVQMMEKAGLTDLRGRYVAPLALRVLEARRRRARASRR